MQNNASSISSSSKSSDRPSFGVEGRNRYELLDECREAVMSKLSQVMRDALEKMAEQLSNDAMASMKREEQQALLEAASLVNQHKLEIENRFKRSFGDIFERRLFTTKATAASESVVSVDQLSLVADEVISDKIEVDRLVHKTKGKLDPAEVLGIRARFGALLEREWFDEQSHPAAPEAIFEALKACLGQFDAKPEVASALLLAFEPHISSNLNAIYSKVNERLVAKQVLPVIRPVIQGVGNTRKIPEAAVGSFPEQTSGRSRDQGTPAHDARTMAAAQMLASLDDPNAAMHAMLANMAQGSAHARANATRLIADPEAFGLIDLPSTPINEVLGRLSAIQNFPVDMSIPPAVFAREFVEKVKDTSGPLDHLMVEVVSMVFDYIYRDSRLNDNIKQQLLRLQVVAIKAALIDKSFFARREHPMRQFLEQVVDICADPETDTSEHSLVATELTSMVDGIVDRFQDDLSLFDESMVTLGQLLERERARRKDWLTQQTDQAYRRELEIALQEKERSKLLERLDDQSPAFVREFLLRWWSGVMVKLSSTQNAEAIEQGVRIAEGLIWSVTPKSPDEIPRLAALLPKLINGLMKGLRFVEITSEDREGFFNELLRTHTKAIEAAKVLKTVAPGTTTITPNKIVQTPAAVTIDANGVLTFKPRARAVHEEAAYAATVTLGQGAIDLLRRGDQLTITRDDGTTARLKLSWVSPGKKFYLLSRFPNIVIQLSRTELVAMLDDGRAVQAHEANFVNDVVKQASQEPQAA